MGYDVILADVPWDFKVWNRDTGSGRSAESHYPTMNLKSICDLPIKELSNKNCVLLFWAVWPRLFDAEKVINAWGFQYKTLGFEWWKLNKKWERHWHLFSPMFQSEQYADLSKLFFMGMGYHTRANSEPCLLATKGKMPVATRGEKNFIIAPVRSHSQKPDEQYCKIDRLYPGTKRLELFARKAQPGWDVFGNQVENSIAMPSKH